MTDKPTTSEMFERAALACLEIGASQEVGAAQAAATYFIAAELAKLRETMERSLRYLETAISWRE